ncbi:hypothetical protein ACN28E_22400 [Archangium lansingense]|uniref:hypothetical protein n=1 Tax=Archangium lansingense TaxID=2995310 RepID=UPI003B7A5634
MPKYKVIMQGGYMSGDMFGVAASMLLDPAVCVLILKGTDQDYLDVMDDQSDRLMAFYKEILGDAQCAARVTVGLVPNPQTYLKGITGEFGRLNQSGATGIRGLFKALKSSDTVELLRIGMATDIVSKVFTWERIVDHFTRDDIQGNIKIFLENDPARKKLLDPYRPRVLLWVRINKRKPKATAHLELDTSVQGVRQIVQRIVEANAKRREVGLPEWTIALTGDRLDLSQPKNKLLKDHCVDLMEFWKAPGWNEAWGRRGQLTLFAFLYGRNAQMVNLGMRSGGLEGPALIGIPTVYMEETDNPQQDRMKKWVGPLRLLGRPMDKDEEVGDEEVGRSGLRLPPPPPSFQRLALSQLPTRTGQAIKSAPGLSDPSAIAKLLDAATKETAGTNRDRLAKAKTEYHRVRGTTFNKFFDLYLVSQGYPWEQVDEAGCEYWRDFAYYYPKTSAEIRRLVGKWYDVRVAKKGSEATGGFAVGDVEAIMGKLNELLPDPVLPKKEEVLPKPLVSTPIVTPSPTIVLESRLPPPPLPSVLTTPSVSGSVGPSSEKRPPVPLSKMGISGQKRWRKTLRDQGLDPKDFWD